MVLRIGMTIAISVIVLSRCSDTPIDVTTYEIASSRLPQSFDRYRIVQISDLHNRAFGRRQSNLVKLVYAARPDMIAMTGDLTFSGAWSAPDTRALVRQLFAVAPVFFVTGNHDTAARDLRGLVQFLEDEGIKVLACRSSRVERAGEAITVAGIDDPHAFDAPGRSRADALSLWEKSLSSLHEDTAAGSFTLLLSHRPELIASYAAVGFNLVLAGHAHGGQVRLPLLGPLYSPDQGWLPSYTAGVYALGTTQMVVSRGLGKSRFPPPLFNGPELVVVCLRSGDRSQRSRERHEARSPAYWPLRLP